MARFPGYLFLSHFSSSQISYSLCNPRATHNGELEVIACPIPISIMQFMIQEWSKLPSEIQASKSLADFKQKLIA